MTTLALHNNLEKVTTLLNNSLVIFVMEVFPNNGKWYFLTQTNEGVINIDTDTKEEMYQMIENICDNLKDQVMIADLQSLFLKLK